MTTNEELKPVDIREKQYRSKVLAGIQSICKRYDCGLDEFDVFHSLVSGESSLYINGDGFLVLRQDIDRYTREKILFVWIAFAFRQNQNLLASEHYINWLEGLARSVKADKLQFCTSRKGYDKLPGWNKTITTFERRLTDE